MHRNRYRIISDRRAKALKDAGAILEVAEKEDRPLTDEERTRFDGFHAEAEGFKRELDLFERQFQAESALQLPDGARLTIDGPRILEDPKRGFENLGDFAMAVYRSQRPSGAVVDPRLAALYQAAPTNYHQETGADEGYEVPPAFRDGIWELVFDEGSILDLVDSEPTGSNVVQFIKDESTPWGTAGVQAKWRAEAGVMTASKLATKLADLRLNELYAFVTATDELLEDAPRLNDRLTRKAAAAIRYKADEAIMFGDGVGKPLGWMNGPALITVLKESGQAAATIVKENLAKMYARMLPGSVSRAVWFANADIFPQLGLLNTGTGGQLIWAPPAAGIAEAPGGFLYGRPIRWTEHAETLGTKGDIQFVDPLGYYAPVKRGGINFASSIHLFFDYGVQAFRWTFRLAGQPYLSAAVSPAKGSATKSHFVCVETRA